LLGTVILVYESNEANYIVHRLVTACQSSIAALVTSRDEGSRSRVASTLNDWSPMADGDSSGPRRLKSSDINFSVDGFPEIPSSVRAPR